MLYMNVIIYHHNTQGLANDGLIIQESMMKMGYTCEIVSYPEEALYDDKYSLNITKVYDLVIFIEHIQINILSQHYALKAKIIFYPNIEWLNKRDAKLCQTKFIHYIYCKTYQSFDILKNIYENKVFYTGFTSLDRYKILPQKYECLHIKGQSKYKNSDIVLGSWMKHPEWPTLHFICRNDVNLQRPIEIRENIILYQYYVTEEELIEIMNRSLIHISPSLSEGFGHYINEGRSCGACVITTDGEPMNEVITPETGYLIPSDSTFEINYGKGYRLNEETFTKYMMEIFENSYETLKHKGHMARLEYKCDKILFNKRLKTKIKYL